MHQTQHNTIVNFIWSIADHILHDVYTRGKYRDLILRRLDAIPEPTGVHRVNEGQLLFLMNMISKMKKNSELGSRFETIHNGSALFTGDAGQGESEKIPTPPITEQKEILNFIKTETASIDTAIAKTEKEIELIKEYNEAMIAEAVMEKIKFNKKKHVL